MRYQDGNCTLLDNYSFSDLLALFYYLFDSSLVAYNIAYNIAVVMPIIDVAIIYII